MIVVYPVFLWALLAVAIPIIIHLFNFKKYKKVYFTNVRFLKELQHQSKAKSRLKEILILIARCLTIACLVLAFAQPIIPSADSKTINTGAKAISIYIDNSFSMENVNKQGAILDIAKTRAKDIIKAFNSVDKFQLITNDFEGKHQRFLSKEDALSVVEELKISSAVRLLSDVVKRQEEFLNTSNLSNKKIYLLSDAQKSTFNVEGLKTDTAIKTTIIPLKANQINNVYIDSCWFETPLQQKGFIQKLHATLVNNGNATIDAGSAKLFLNKQQLALSSYSLEPNSKTEIVFTFECKQSGLNYGSVKIEDYPITFDDELFFAFNSKVNVAVTLITGKDVKENNALETLFNNDSLFKLNAFTEQTIDFGAFKTSDVIVLNQLSDISSGLLSELVKFSNQGGSVVFIPAQNSNIPNYNLALTNLQLPNFTNLDTASLKIDRIELASKFYTGVFDKVEDRLNLPQINKHYRIVKTNASKFETILQLQNTDAFFGMSSNGNSISYLFTAPFIQNATNFSKHALFVPTFYRICFSSLKSTPLFYQTNSNVLISLKNDAAQSEQPPHIKQIDSQLDIIPEQRIVNNALFLYTRNQINANGFYEVLKTNNPVLPLAFNFSRKESNLNCYTIDELSKVIADKGSKNLSLIEDAQSDISKQILQGADGKKLWKLFILLALFFVAIEISLLRFL
ncbi:MAG: BatA and WFA domain-containing protein [Bacteroidota bacterium]|nr:BatA and WFA domain-containing protein [Bacteroidota bacterium]